MTSANVPDWLIELNMGNIDYDYFGKDQDFVEREFVYQIFDNALTTIWLYWMRAREGNVFISKRMIIMDMYKTCNDRLEKNVDALMVNNWFIDVP